MHILKTTIFFIITLFYTNNLFASSGSLHIDPQTERQILKSLDIDPAFMQDIHYIDTKENIDKLKKLFFLKTLKRGNLFMPNLQALLNEADIPRTFLYMAMVESKFLADSKSHKHAAGLWQFMPATAKTYKLKRNRHIDERLDPIKSTKAAIAYLKYLHSRFGKWYLAAMAYNCGEGRLAQAIKKAGTDDLAVLLDDDSGYLPKETRNYIQRIIVAALLAHDKSIIKQNNKNHLFGFCSNKKLIKLYFKGGQSLKTIAVKIGVPYRKLEACNPHLIKKKLPPNPKKMYYLYLPEDLAQKAEQRIKNSGESFVYHVQPNDTLFLISKRFNIRMRALRMLNPQLEKSRVLKIGMPLTILGKAPLQQESNRTKAKKRINRVVRYTLEENSTLYRISAKFNNKIALLKKLNPGIKERLTKGETIKIVRDINLTQKADTNITAKFKTVAIARSEHNTSRDGNRTPPAATQSEQNRSLAKREQNATIGDRNRTAEQTPPIHFTTLTHRIEAGETLEKIAAKLKLRVEDILKEGNVMIIKLKNQPRKRDEDHNRSEISKTP